MPADSAGIQTCSIFGAERRHRAKLKEQGNDPGNDHS